MINCLKIYKDRKKINRNNILFLKKSVHHRCIKHILICTIFTTTNKYAEYSKKQKFIQFML